MVLAKKHVPIVKKRMSKSCLPVFQSSTSTTAQVPCIARVSGKGRNEGGFARNFSMKKRRMISLFEGKIKGLENDWAT